MKKNIMLLIAILLSTLNSSELTTNTTIQCINTSKKELQINIASTALNLTDDAVVDNTGGYVDIPEEKYYLKSKSHIFKIYGKVILKPQNNINTFSSTVKLGNLQTLLKEQFNIKLIQKIDLIENNQDIMEQNVTTTNTLELKFPNNIQQQIKNCKK